MAARTCAQGGAALLRTRVVSQEDWGGLARSLPPWPGRRASSPMGRPYRVLCMVTSYLLSLEGVQARGRLVAEQQPRRPQQLHADAQALALPAPARCAGVRRPAPAHPRMRAPTGAVAPLRAAGCSCAARWQRWCRVRGGTGSVRGIGAHHRLSLSVAVSAYMLCLLPSAAAALYREHHEHLRLISNELEGGDVASMGGNAHPPLSPRVFSSPTTLSATCGHKDAHERACCTAAGATQALAADARCFPPQHLTALQHAPQPARQPQADSLRCAQALAAGRRRACGRARW